MDPTPEQRAAKKAERRAAKQALSNQQANEPAKDNTVDVACVIHGTVYNWYYVEKLHSMVSRHLHRPFRFHVYTEANRPVPAQYIKHELQEWPGIVGPKKSWWYKMQLFNTAHHRGPLLYFDLDVVIVNNIDWITELSTRHFWAVRDFKYLWRPTHSALNSSIMWWDTNWFEHVWTEFQRCNIMELCRRYHGDQDYIDERITPAHRRLFSEQQVISWRWQAHDGGTDFKKRKQRTPSTGTQFSDQTSVLIFHGQPKPHEVQDPVIVQNWR